MPLIVDLSANNGGVTLGMVKGAGAAGCWHKATEGRSFVDRDFRARREQAAMVGLRFGGYHFARPDLHPSGAALEARNFASVVGKPGRRDLRPALDFEHEAPNLSPAELVAWAREWNKVVHDLLGVWPVFYSYSDFVRRLRPSWPIGAALWLADYGRNDGVQHPARVPTPWRKIHAHQFTSRGSIRGVAGVVDLSMAPRLRPLLAHPFTGLV